MKKHSNASEAIQCIQSGHRIFVHGAAATPNTLLKAIVAEADRFLDVEFMHLHTMGAAEYMRPEYKKNFRTANLFVGANARPYLDHEQNDYLPCFLSEMPKLIRSERRPVDVALIHVSPPDKHGYCSLGTSVDAARAAVDTAKLIVAQVNSRMPRVQGDGIIHMSQIDHGIDVIEELHEHLSPSPDSVTLAIGRRAASLIEDGATLQAGIGAIPDAVLAELTGHRHLGLHTEMWSDGALKLILSGVIDNSRKVTHRGKSVSTFLMGSRELYDYVDDNPSVIQLGADYVNSPTIIARNPKVTAINSAVEVDLTGQVCADSIGGRIISGVGGQMDFIRAASISPNGKPIIALPSRTHRGLPRIVPQLRAGAGVVTTRAHVHYVVTEYGVADLYGKTLRERAHELISVAHPEDREGLERSFYRS